MDLVAELAALEYAGFPRGKKRPGRNPVRRKLPTGTCSPASPPNNSDMWSGLWTEIIGAAK
jgi:hypothetical protein